MFTVTINARALKAAACAASSEETRYYLAGVNVEFLPTGIVMVATDGHMLCAIRQDYASPDECGLDAVASPPLIVPLDMINRLKIARKSEGMARMTVDGRMITLALDGVAVMGEAIDGSFPAWRAIVPKKCDGKPAQFNPHYIVAFSKMRDMMGFSKSAHPVINYSGDNQALVDWMRDEATPQLDGFGVVMPIRFRDAHKAAPAWGRT